MKLRTARNIVISACVVVAIFYILGSLAKNSIIVILSGVVAVSAMIFWVIFGRCPYCGKFLGRTNDKHCSHCGKELEW